MRRVFGVLLPFVLLASALVAPSAAAAGSRAYLIGSKAPLTTAQVAALQDAGAVIKHRYRNFGGAAALIPDTRVAAVRALRFVTGVTLDRARQPDSVRVERAATAADIAQAALPGTPYWHDLIDLEAVSGGYDGSGVWVAVMDTGFYPNWRDYFEPSTILTDKARSFQAAAAMANENQWWVGSDPHGMATAATIVGYYLHDDTNEGGWGEGYATGSAGTYWVPGVAPGAKVIPLKVCEPIGCFTSALNAAMDYVISLKKANPSQPIVINESIGGPGLSAVEKAALDAVAKAGIVHVASAGNSGNAGMGFPGAYEPVISVGMGGWTDQWNEYPDKTWWLDDVPDYGSDDVEVDNEVFVVDGSSRQLAGQYLDVVSTGRFMLLPYPCINLYKDGEIVSRTNVRTCATKATPEGAADAAFQYLFISGTSFSAPTVAGIAARMLDKNPALSNADAVIGSLNDPGTWGTGGSAEHVLESAAESIEPGRVTTVYRTGIPDVECWEIVSDPAKPDDCPLEATGYGWVHADEAVANTP